jgi:uncharacterized sulfatase
LILGVEGRPEGLFDRGMKPRCWSVIALLWFASSLICMGDGLAKSTPPNLIFILADDLGYGDLGCYGQERIRTPRLDRMAAEGMRFTQVYAGSTVCAPSRCALMTGRHMGHARVRGNAGGLRQALRGEDVTVAHLLREAGYATGLVGKWGLGDVGAGDPGLPRRQGFEGFFGYLNQRHAHNYYPSFLWRNEERVRLRNTVPNEDAEGAGVSDNRVEYSADLITDEALAFIRRHRERPFFLYFAPTIPHANNEAGAAGMEVPDLGWYRDRDWPAAQKAHAAMVSRLDRDVGRLLDLLQELGLDQRTIVFFSSDNGPHREGGFNPAFSRSSGPLRGLKRDLYEGGIRVPMLVRGPGRVPAGRVSDQVWAFWDFLPTALDLAGARARVPADTDGLSMRPALEGRRQRRQHEALYWEFHEGGFKQAIRAGDWKGVRLGPGRPLEVYDLRRDPGETVNLAGQRPEVVKRLAGLLARARRESPDWPVLQAAPAGR